MSAQTSTHRKKTRQGATMVEFAVVALPMFFLIFGLLEFARVSMMGGIADDACYEACRNVIVPGAVAAEGQAEGNRILGILGTRGGTVTIVPKDIDGATQADIDENTATVTANVSIPMAQNMLFAGRWTGDIVLQRTCTMTTERFAGFFDGTSGTVSGS